MSNYSYSVFWSEEDAAYIAVCPEFPGLSAFGSEPGAALASIQEAVEAAIETYAEENWTLPEAEDLSTYSGQFRVRVPKSLHAALVQRATLEGVSLNSLVVALLSQALSATETAAAIADECRAVLAQLQRTAFQAILDVANMQTAEHAESHVFGVSAPSATLLGAQSNTSALSPARH